MHAARSIGRPQQQRPQQTTSGAGGAGVGGAGGDVASQGGMGNVVTGAMRRTHLQQSRIADQAYALWCV